MRKAVLVLMFALMCGTAFAAPKLIDSFDKNALLKTPEWWQFGSITAKIDKGRLSLSGSAKDWYCGGVGTYLGIDASMYKGIELDVTGNGSGSIKVEVYDDDKGSWETGYDKVWVPLKDDLWTYTQQIDWTGPKHLKLAFEDFTLSNPKGGDGKLNLDQKNGSGGLLQVQLVMSAGTKDGKNSFSIDNIQLY